MSSPKQRRISSNRTWTKPPARQTLRVRWRSSGCLVS